MNQEQMTRQELFKKTPEEKALLKKLKSEYNKKQANNGQEKRQHVLGQPEKRG